MQLNFFVRSMCIPVFIVDSITRAIDIRKSMKISNLNIFRNHSYLWAFNFKVIEFSSRNFVTPVALEDEGYLGYFENSIKVVNVLQFYLFHIAPQILLNKREVERVVSLTRTCGTEEMKEISYCYVECMWSE